MNVDFRNNALTFENEAEMKTAMNLMDIGGRMYDLKKKIEESNTSEETKQKMILHIFKMFVK